MTILNYSNFAVASLALLYMTAKGYPTLATATDDCEDTNATTIMTYMAYSNDTTLGEINLDALYWVVSLLSRWSNLFLISTGHYQ